MFEETPALGEKNQGKPPWEGSIRGLHGKGSSGRGLAIGKDLGLMQPTSKGGESR